MLVGLLLTLMTAEPGPDPVIYPHQVIPLHFDHAYHTRTSSPALGIEGEALSCTFCHTRISSSREAADRDIPGHEECESCHFDWIGDEEDPAAITDCVNCHRDLSPTSTSTRASPMLIPPPNLIFPHDRHLAAGLSCVDCHGQVPSKALATREDFPMMRDCVTCHADQGASTRCTTCHLSTPRGTVQTAYAEGQLVPKNLHRFAAHEGDFLRSHAVPAARDPDYCASCHTKDDCLSCHVGFGRDGRYHPGDFIATHPLRARKDDHRCDSCHRLQSFCVDCHVRTGVASVGSVADPTARRTILRRDNVAVGPHPMSADGWLDRRSRNFHGFHAQRNIRSCASCHQEQYCIACHQSGFQGGSVGGNPHGPNAARLRGTAAASRNARACLKCHSPADPSWR